jgi:type IV pilus assembly protein PilE
MQKTRRKLSKTRRTFRTAQPFKPSCSGWTLAELLITLALMGVLAALALPTYQQQQRQARRTDGQAALLQLQVDQVQWRSNHERYAQTLTDLGWASDKSPQGHYQITITEARAEAYTAQATAVGSQAADRACSPLRLSWQGSATAVWGAGEHTNSDPDRCWRR